MSTSRILSRCLDCQIEAPLADGRRVGLRPIRTSDAALIRDGIAAMSERSRYLRFFSAFRTAPDVVVDRLSAVDGHDHIGWGAILLDGDEETPIAAAHAIRTGVDARHAELAIAVLDDYQGLGLAPMLLAALLADCVDEGLDVLDIQMLGENRPAIDLMLGLGAIEAESHGSVISYQLVAADALARLRARGAPAGLVSKLEQIDRTELMPG